MNRNTIYEKIINLFTSKKEGPGYTPEADIMYASYIRFITTSGIFIPCMYVRAQVNPLSIVQKVHAL